MDQKSTGLATRICFWVDMVKNINNLLKKIVKNNNKKMRVFGVSFLLANLDIKILQNNTFT